MMGEAVKMKYLTRFFSIRRSAFPGRLFYSGNYCFKISIPSSYTGSTLAPSLVRQ